MSRVWEDLTEEEKDKIIKRFNQPLRNYNIYSRDVIVDIFKSNDIEFADNGIEIVKGECIDEPNLVGFSIEGKNI